MGSLRRFVAFLPPALALVAIAPSASAESSVPPPRCRETVLPSTGTTVPANLPAIVVDQSLNSPGVTSTILADELTGGATPVKLVAVPDPKLPKVTLLVPTTNDLLAAGTTYSLAYTVDCSTLPPVESHATSFGAGPAVTLPTRIGDVREVADGTAVITLTAEQRAFLQTTRFEVSVDGTALPSTGYGSLLDTAEITVTGDAWAIGLATGGPFVRAEPGLLCPAGATRAAHDVKLVAHVAGTDTDTAPLSFHISVDCTKPTSTSAPYLPDGGGDDRGASASGGSGDVNAAATDGGGGGCSIGGSGPLGSLAAFFATGAAMAVLFRRRRAAARR